MSVGKIVRKIFGKRFYSLAKIYRSFFVDLDFVVESLGDIKEQAKILDIGGGDGALADILLSKIKNAQVTIIDTCNLVGEAISERNKIRARLFRNLKLADFNKRQDQQFDLIVVSDVVHHIPVKQRNEFFVELGRTLKSNPGAKLAIKEIQPGYLKSKLSVLSDWFITSDKHVGLIGKQDIIKKMSEVEPRLKAQETNLFEKNKPNYCVLFEY